MNQPTQPTQTAAINIIFDAPPGPQMGRFVEVETDDGRGVSCGEWIERPDGFWALRITHLPPQPTDPSSAMSEEQKQANRARMATHYIGQYRSRVESSFAAPQGWSITALRMQMHQLETTLLYGGPSEICGAIDAVDSALDQLRETVCATPKAMKNTTDDQRGESFAASDGSAFLSAKLNDATVARMLKEGAGPEAIIGQLAADKEQYLKHIMELESIAPRKIVLPDGRVMVWQCPPELVPPMNTPNNKSSNVPPKT